MQPQKVNELPPGVCLQLNCTEIIKHLIYYEKY